MLDTLGLLCHEIRQLAEVKKALGKLDSLGLQCHEIRQLAGVR